jgi:hypothetical protein
MRGSFFSKSGRMDKKQRWKRWDSQRLHALSTGWSKESSKVFHLFFAALIMSSNGPKIISTGTDAELLWLRNAVLKSAGFDVTTTANEDEALIRIRQGDCGVLLLCYSLSETSRRELVDTFKHYCPNGRIVAIANRKMEEPEFADGLVFGVEGPEALIDAIRAR